jgi:hypothetical protein
MSRHQRLKKRYVIIRSLKGSPDGNKYPCRVVRTQKRAAWEAYDMDKRYPLFKHSIQEILSEI